MKNILRLSVLVFCIFLLSGCAGKVEGVDGMMYTPLSKSQIRHLVIISRASLKESLNKKRISRIEYRDAMKTEPMVKIEYRGDRFGTAYVSWRTRERLIEFRYEDDISAKIIPKCAFITSVIPPHERNIQPDKSIRGR